MSGGPQRQGRHPHEHQGPTLFEAYSPMTPGWYNAAACIDMPINIFFPDVTAEDSKNVNGRQYDPGKLICDRCPVRVACLEWALTFPEREGLWGGKSPEERNRIRRRSA